MSWSVNFKGKPADVVKSLRDESAKLSGQSKVEYDDALPHVVALVEQNFGNPTSEVKLSANGSGSAQGGKQFNRSCSVTLQG
jgi:hypothetical protein